MQQIFYAKALETTGTVAVPTIDIGAGSGRSARGAFPAEEHSFSVKGDLADLLAQE